jgi:hypothetical protein
MVMSSTCRNVQASPFAFANMLNIVSRLG